MLMLMLMLMLVILVQVCGYNGVEFYKISFVSGSSFV